MGAMPDTREKSSQLIMGSPLSGFLIWTHHRQGQAGVRADEATQTHARKHTQTHDDGTAQHVTTRFNVHVVHDAVPPPTDTHNKRITSHPVTQSPTTPHPHTLLICSTPYMMAQAWVEGSRDAHGTASSAATAAARSATLQQQQRTQACARRIAAIRVGWGSVPPTSATAPHFAPIRLWPKPGSTL